MSVTSITKERFPDDVLRADKPVLLDFWATWCGPCRMIAPILEEIAQERSDILVGKIHVDQEMELATQFQIVSIPTLIVMKDGRETARSIGCCSKEEILALL